MMAMELEMKGVISCSQYITQLTHLFCSRLHQRWREKNDADSVSDGRASAHGGVCVARGVLHKNTASRKLSRLTRRLATLG